MKAAVEQDYVLRKDNRNLSHLPGDYGLPYLGFMIPLLKDPYAVLKKHYDRYGPVSRTQLTGQRIVWALGPDFNRELVMDPQQVYSAKMGYDTVLGDFFAGGLLVRDFPRPGPAPRDPPFPERSELSRSAALMLLSKSMDGRLVPPGTPPAPRGHGPECVVPSASARCS